MAELKRLNLKRQDDFGNDDPLTELSRIMGLPEKPATAAVTRADNDLDDFGIDLERELLGEFAPLDETPVDAGDDTARPISEAEETPDPATPLPQVHVDALERELADQFADAFDGADVSDVAEGQATSVVSAQPADATADDLPLDAFHLDLDMDFGDDAPAAAAGMTAQDDEPFANLPDDVLPESHERPSLADQLDHLLAEDEVAPAAGDPLDELAAEQPTTPGHAAFDVVGKAPVAADEAVARDVEPEPVDLDFGDLEPEPLPAPAPVEPASAPVQAAAPDWSRPRPAAPAAQAYDPFAELAAMARASAERASRGGIAQPEASARAPETPVATAIQPAAPSEWRDAPAMPDETLASAFDEPVGLPEPDMAHAAPLAGRHDAGPAAVAAGWTDPHAPRDVVASADEPFEADTLDARNHEHEARGEDRFAPEDLDLPDLDQLVEAASRAETSSHADRAWRDHEALHLVEDAPAAVVSDDQPIEMHQSSAARDDIAAATTENPPAPRSGATVQGVAAAALAATSSFASRFGMLRTGGEAGPATASPAPRGVASPAPDIETVEVPEQKIEAADELDIPDFVVEDAPRAPDSIDDVDLDFASAFEELAAPKPAAAPVARVAEPAEVAPDLEDFVLDASETDIDAEHQAAHGAYAVPAYADAPDDAWPIEGRERFEEEELASAFHGAVAQRAASRTSGGGRRGFVVAGVVGAVAIIGGVAALALSFGGGDTDAPPALVKADPSPVKVRPEKPGGVTVPNQDKMVYDRTAAADGEKPAQETLVSNVEEPVDLAARTAAEPSEVDTAPAPSAKSDDRIEAAPDDALPGVTREAPAVTPRKVRTMMVRADGTLVPREEAPEEVAAAEEPPSPTTPIEDAPMLATALEPADAAPAPAAETTPSAPAGDAAAPAAADAASPANDEEPAEPATAEANVRKVETTSFRRDDAQGMPSRGPVAPTRPADQPVEIVGTTPRATEVAAADPTPPPAARTTQPAAAAAAPDAPWAMQIASQPSPEGAQKSYADLSRRYGEIIGGRGVNIVKADIEGKGTFYRVRIPATTRAEAIDLCERYKAAGGSCFVGKS